MTALMLLLALWLPPEASPPASEARPPSATLAFPVPAADRTTPSDTFGDPGVRALVERARAARGNMAEGLDSFDGRIWERLYAGVDGRGFRRERGIIQEERSGRMRWTASGDRLVQWEAGRREFPIVGWSSLDDERDEGESYARELVGSQLPPPLASFDPHSDQLFLGGREHWFLHPLADTAGVHYRFESGDSLRLTLAGMAEPITLSEVVVLPRRSDFRLIAASMWFERETGALVRAVYRPARPFNLRIDSSDGDIPGFFPSIGFEIPRILVEYSLQDFSWWLPYRFSFEGEGSVGRFARFPMVVEWVVSDLWVNEEEPADLIPDPLPDGWYLQVRSARADTLEADDSSGRVVVVSPSAAELREGAGLREIDFRDRVAFTGSELDALERRLRSFGPPPGTPLESAWGVTEELTRFNRVEGLATGALARVTLPRGAGRLSGEVRIGTEALLPTGELLFEPDHSRWISSLGAYHRLVPSADFDAPHALGASVSTLVLGGGPSPFHYAAGLEASREWRAPGSESELTVFAEWHRSAERGTSFHLRQLFDSGRRLPAVLPADEGFYSGMRAVHRWQSGLAPDRVRLFVRSAVEVATGETDYARGQLGAALAIPLTPGLAGALEVAGGGAVGQLPQQRHFFPGGPASYRGGQAGERAGEGYTLVRGELGRGVAGARIILFADAMKLFQPLIDPPAPLRDPFQDWHYAAGGGLSFLDGLIRVELARAMRPDPGWRGLLYFDGLF
ncbi:MAG: hypothetical protein EA351_04090 [Gemmatimonadales bacterium]|nr:MAG: hypothetical protein EA351_04090 [Gemmatimonadales bacterium]